MAWEERANATVCENHCSTFFQHLHTCVPFIKKDSIRMAAEIRMKDKIFVIDDEYIIGTYYDNHCIKLYFLNVIDITPYTATISIQKRMSRLNVVLYVDGFILEG